MNLKTSFIAVAVLLAAGCSDSGNHNGSLTGKTPPPAPTVNPTGGSMTRIASCAKQLDGNAYLCVDFFSNGGSGQMTIDDANQACAQQQAQMVQNCPTSGVNASCKVVGQKGQVEELMYSGSSTDIQQFQAQCNSQNGQFDQ